jgi:hypothetical protein
MYMRWAEHAVGMGDIKCAKYWIQKPKDKRQLGRPIYRW